DMLPDFLALSPAKKGVTDNFDVRERTRDTNVALTFHGRLQAPQSGIYTFWARSDDGSRLWLDDQVLSIRALGAGSLPAPVSILPGEPVREELENRWAQTEGTVVDVDETPEGVTMELNSGTGPAYLKVPGGDRASLRKLLHRRIEASGICQSIYSLAGQSVP